MSEKFSPENIIEVFRDKENVPTPITDKLEKCGYKQKSGGYINKAKKQKRDNPSQYWHITESWPKDKEGNIRNNAKFGSISCGELIIWMAEVLKVIPEKKLKEVSDKILENPKDRPRAENIIKRQKLFEKVKQKISEIS